MNRIASWNASRLHVVMACVMCLLAALLWSSPSRAEDLPDQSAIVGQNTVVEIIVFSDDTNYAWSLIAKPAGSTATLDTNNLIGSTSFTPDLPGVYRISLDVTGDDGTSHFYYEKNVIALDPLDVTQQAIGLILDFLAELPDGDWNAPGHETAFANYLEQIVNAVAADDYATAVRKIDDALNRTDGYVLRGAMDLDGAGKDWVKTPETQQFLYAVLSSVRNMLAQP
jgi:hypothetical protein